MSSITKLPSKHRQRRMLKAGVGGSQQEAPSTPQLQEQMLKCIIYHQLEDQTDKAASMVSSDQHPQQATAADPEVAQLLHPSTLQQMVLSITVPESDVAASRAPAALKRVGMQLQQAPAARVDQEQYQDHQQRQNRQHDVAPDADQIQVCAAAQQRVHKQQHGQLSQQVAMDQHKHNVSYPQQQQQQIEQEALWSMSMSLSADHQHRQQQQQLGVLETLFESPTAADASADRTMNAAAAAARSGFTSASADLQHNSPAVILSPAPSGLHELLAAFPDMLGDTVGEPLCSSHASIGLMSAVQPAAAAAAGPSSCIGQHSLAMSNEASNMLLPNGANSWQQQQQSENAGVSSSSSWDLNARRFSDSAIWPVTKTSAVTPAASDTMHAAAAAAVPPRPASSLGHRILRPHSSSPIPSDSGSTPIRMTQLGSGELLVDITPPTKVTTQISWSLDPDAEYLLDASTSGSLGPGVPLPGSSSSTAAAAAAGNHNAMQPGSAAGSSTGSVPGSTAAAAGSSNGGSWGANLDGFGSGPLPRNSSSSSSSSWRRGGTGAAAAAAGSAPSPRVSSSSSSSSKQGSIKHHAARNRPRLFASSAAGTAAAGQRMGDRQQPQQQQQQALGHWRQQQQQQQISVISTPSASSRYWPAQQHPNALSDRMQQHQPHTASMSAGGVPATAAVGLGSSTAAAANDSHCVIPRSQYVEDVTPSMWHPSDAAEHSGDYLDLYRRAYCSHGDVLFPPLWLTLMWLITTSRLLPLLPLLLLIVTTWFAGCYMFVIKGLNVSSSQLGMTRLPAVLVLSLEILCTGCFLFYILPEVWLGHSVTCAAGITAAAAMLGLHWAAYVQDPGYVPLPQQHDTELGLSSGNAVMTQCSSSKGSTSSSAAASTKQPLPLTLSSSPLLPAAAQSSRWHKGPFSKQQQQQQSSVPQLCGRSLISCWSCGVDKNLRSKHCPVCKRCVQRFDHHCPVIGNCVGARNHKTFVTYLVTLVICQLLFVHLLGGMLFQWHVTHVTAGDDTRSHRHSLLTHILMSKPVEKIMTAATAAAAAGGTSSSSSSSSSTGSTVDSDSTAASSSIDHPANIVLDSTTTQGIDGRMTAVAATAAPIVRQPAAAAAIAAATATTAAAATSSSSSEATKLDVLLHAGGDWGLSHWWLTVQVLAVSAESSPGLLLLLLLQVPALIWSCSLLLRALLLAAANLTVNEWLNRHRYLHLQHRAAGFCNRFDRGPAHNCWEFWFGPSDVDWWSVWYQADEEVRSSSPRYILVPLSATSIIRFWDNRWARYQQKVMERRRIRQSSVADML